MSWKHKPGCTPTECYCADDDSPDPVCDCGLPAWACECEEDPGLRCRLCGQIIDSGDLCGECGKKGSVGRG